MSSLPSSANGASTLRGRIALEETHRALGDGVL